MFQLTVAARQTRQIGAATSILCALTLGFANAAAAQCESDRDRPSWVHETPRGYLFDYYVGIAEGNASAEAEKLSLNNAIAEVGRNGMLTVLSHSFAKQEEKSVALDGSDAQVQLVSHVAEEVQVKGESTSVRGLSRLENFLERCSNGSYRVHTLVSVPKRMPLEAPSTGHWLVRSLVPSWAQFEKGNDGRAWFILVGEGLTIPAAIVSATLGSTARANAALATRQADRDFYNNRADQLNVAALVFGATAAALYIYNVIDGTVSEEWNVRQ